MTRIIWHTAVNTPLRMKHQVPEKISQDDFTEGHENASMEKGPEDSKDENAS